MYCRLNTVSCSYFHGSQFSSSCAFPAETNWRLWVFSVSVVYRNTVFVDRSMLILYISSTHHSKLVCQLTKLLPTFCFIILLINYINRFLQHSCNWGNHTYFAGLMTAVQNNYYQVLYFNIVFQPCHITYRRYSEGNNLMCIVYDRIERYIIIFPLSPLTQTKT